MTLGPRRIPADTEPQDLAAYLRGLAERHSSLLAAHVLQLEATARESSDGPALRWPAGVDEQTPAEVGDAPLPSIGSRSTFRLIGPRRPVRFEPTRECMNLVAHAEAIGVAFTWAADAPRLGGYVTRPESRSSVRRDIKNPPTKIDPRDLPAATVGDGVIVFNHAQDWASTFDVLVHEVAHVLLGHLRGWATLRQHDMQIADRGSVPKLAMEVEAHAVGLLVAARRGADVSVPGRLLPAFFRPASRTGDLVHVDLLQVVAVADIITGWCAEPPDSTGWATEPRPVPDHGGSGSSRYQADDEDERPSLPRWMSKGAGV